MSNDSKIPVTTVQHTVKRYDTELEHIRESVLTMGSIVGQQLNDALMTLGIKDAALRALVKNRECELDQMEANIDEAILELVARRCPMGSDLRSIISFSKCVGDLEKIGDEAVRIVGFTEELSESNGIKLNEKAITEVMQFGRMAICLYQEAMALFKVWDEDKARRIIHSQKEMDGEFQSELQRLMTYITEDSLIIKEAVCMALVAKSCDRITHHAQNLVEHAIFEAKGIDIRIKS